MKKEKQKYLLPTGFYDLLALEASINQESINILLKKFHDFGYNFIKTPLVEFEESLKGNQKLNEQSFKIIDVFSGKNLAVRSDITAQITRLINTKLSQAHFPLRLCYAGYVLKVKNDDLYADRQLTQAGIELIGSDSINASLEVIEVIMQGLGNIKLPNLLIDFCLPQFLNSLLQELKIPNYEKLQEAINNKNISAIKKLAGKFAKSLINLTLQISNFTIIKKELNQLPISKILKEKVINLEKIIQKIKANYPDLAIVVNIFGDADFLYHQEIGFTIFEEGFPYPIARGGRYVINDQIPAIGATVYINNLRKILVKLPKESKKIVLIAFNSTSTAIHKLQQQGYITIKFLEEKKINQQQFIAAAKKLGCNFIYLNNQIKSLEGQGQRKKV